MALKEAIVNKYGTLSIFAKNIGWSHHKVSCIVNGKQELTAKDMEIIADKLDICTADQFREFFFGI